MENNKETKAVLEIRKREDYHFERTKFYRDHNMTIAALFHKQMEMELRQLSSEIEEILGTGYVSLEKYK